MIKLNYILLILGNVLALVVEISTVSLYNYYYSLLGTPQTRKREIDNKVDYSNIVQITFNNMHNRKTLSNASVIMNNLSHLQLLSK